jgi:hypothetical protein
MGMDMNISTGLGQEKRGREETGRKRDLFSEPLPYLVREREGERSISTDSYTLFISFFGRDIPYL